MNLSVSIEDKVTPALDEIISALKGAGKRELNQAMGKNVQVLVTDYLRTLDRHNTAQSLGGTPTGHWEDASRKVSAGGSLTSDENGATLDISHPGIGRAFGDVTITPGTRTSGAQYLPIALIGEAYGMRPREFDRDKALFFIRTKAGKAFLARNTDSGLELVYSLISGAVQKQDRTLLPSEEALTDAALAGANTFISMALKKRGKL